MRVAHVNCDPGIRPGRKKGAAVHVEAMRCAFADLDVEVIAVDPTPGESAAELLAEACASRPLDLIYERYAIGACASARFARDRGIPLVLEVNAPLLDEERWFRGRDPGPDAVGAERELFGLASLILAVSEDVAAYVRRHGVSGERIRVRPNAVDPRRFHPERAAGLRDELFAPTDFVLGFHGRLRPWHGFERFVDLVARLRDEGHPVRALVVGEGDFRAALDRKLERGVAVVSGWCPHEEVGRWVACFDALPLTYDPARPCYFSPLKLYEAMASAAVPVVPALGDLPRLVRHGQSGSVYPAGDWDALSEALRALARDPDYRAELARGALAVARAHTWTNLASEVLESVRRRAS